MTKCVKICIENDEEEEDSVKLNDEQINELIDNFSQVIMKIITQLSSMDEDKRVSGDE